MRTAFVFLVVALGVSACAALRGPLPDRRAADRGAVFAARACAGCHAIRQGASPNPESPTFAELSALRPDYLAGTMAEVARNGHVGMPPIYMTPDEQRDVAAYILSRRHTPSADGRP